MIAGRNGRRRISKARSFLDAWNLILTCAWFAFAGLSRTRDNIRNQLSELVKQKPRNKEDETLISEMTRLEAVLQVARDDFVRRAAIGDCIRCSFSHLWSFQSACNHKLQGIKDELKHIDKSLKQNAPEHTKVLSFRISHSLTT